jgi:hypothetical protein
MILIVRPLTDVKRTIDVLVGAIPLKVVIHETSIVLITFSKSECPNAVFSGSQKTSNISSSVPVEKGPISLLEIF